MQVARAAWRIRVDVRESMAVDAGPWTIGARRSTASPCAGWIPVARSLRALIEDGVAVATGRARRDRRAGSGARSSSAAGGSSLTSSPSARPGFASALGAAGPQRAQRVRRRSGRVIPGRDRGLCRVAEGDTVEAGQQLLVVEAMKMQNEIRAPRAGIVERVAVGMGQAVELGASCW